MEKTIDYKRLLEERELELAVGLDNDDFIGWAEAFFADERHFGTPISLDEMIISHKAYLGEKTITYEMVRKSYRLFRRKLRAYCECTRIIVNPDVIFMPRKKPKDWESWDEDKRNEFRKRFSPDRREGVVRRFMWTHPFQDGRVATEQPRELRIVRGYFFFKSEEDVFVDIWDFDEDHYKECDWERKIG